MRPSFRTAVRPASRRTSSVPCPLAVAATLIAATAGSVAPSVARAQAATDTVRLAGRALVGSGVLQQRTLHLALEHGGRGVWVFSRTVNGLAVSEGDSVAVVGVGHRYRGTTEVVASTVRVVPGTRRLVAPLAVGPVDAGRVVANEGRLVRVRGVIGAQGPSEGGHWVRLHRADGGARDSVTLWIPPSHRHALEFAPMYEGDEVEATGIAMVFRDNPNDAPVAQLVPRTPGDVVTIGIPHHWITVAWQSALVAGAVIALGVLLVRAVTRSQARALKETEARYRQLLELSPDAVLVHAEGRVLFANPAAARLLGVTDEHALADRPLETFIGETERHALAAAVGVGRPAGVVRAGQRLRTRFFGAGGAPVDVEAATSPCRFNDQEAAVIVARDIGPQLRYERELKELALLDELTGLHNRRGFLTFAELELRRLRQLGRDAVLLFADLDGLKGINDAHGHAAGDEALRVLADALREVVGEQGLAARWSGDEFAALVPEPDAHPDAAPATDALVAEQFEWRLRAAIARRTTSRGRFAVAATVGATQLPFDGGQTLAAALAAADAGLYRRRADARHPSRG